MLRVATVLSAREWEARFVAAVRDTAVMRLVLRAYQPDEVSSRAADIDVVVAGAETPWVTPTRIATWQRLGLRVVGIHPAVDRPSARRLEAGGADLVFDDTVDADRLIREIRLAGLIGPVPEPIDRRVVAVTGTRGGPGRTEISVAIAWAQAGVEPTTLIDADLEGPGISIRLGLSPSPDLADFVDRLLDGETVGDAVHRVGRMGVVTGVRRPESVRVEAVADLIETCAVEGPVIVDCGPWDHAMPLLREADEVVFVAEATPTGIVRGSALVGGWELEAPQLVLNKLDRRFPSDAVAAMRRWSGLEPVAVIPHRSDIRRRALSAGPPARILLSAIAPIIRVPVRHD
jgi:MinD-like ATPase involved in chromosome partitioning or flagellar assembly